MTRSFFILLTLFLATTVVMQASNSVHAQTRSQLRNKTHCALDEINYFSCNTTNGALIGLCGDPRTKHVLQYRYGEQNAIKFRYPISAKDANKEFKYAHYFRAETDYWELRFKNRDVSYTLFDRRIGREKSAGVEVLLSDGKERQIACVGKYYSVLDALKTLVPCALDSVLNMGSCPEK
jgi:hypothetical protein